MKLTNCIVHSNQKNSAGRVSIGTAMVLATALTALSLLLGNSAASRDKTNAGTAATGQFTEEELLDLLFISDFETNQPPQIVSIPRRYASPGQPYEYPVAVFDPEGDPVLFALTGAAPGMDVDLLTGMVTWSDPLFGEHPVEIIAQDIFGGQATQSWVLTVGENSPPQILSMPLTDAMAGESWVYEPEVFDPDSDSLEFSLEQGPSGMTIDLANRPSRLAARHRRRLRRGLACRGPFGRVGLTEFYRDG